MTYFETPNDQAAYIAGMSTEAYENMLDAIAEDEERLYFMGQPHLEPEDRDFVDEADVMMVTPQDRADLQTVLDWEAFEGFGR